MTSHVLAPRLELSSQSRRRDREEGRPAPLDIVFIHGLCGNEGESWSRADHPRQTIEAIAPASARILTFQCDLRLEESFSWEVFLEKSSNLLQFLYEIHRLVMNDPRPMILICQGLGGILLKQTLWKVRQQAHRFHEFIVAISGIIFLATPHIVRADTEAVKTIVQILKADLKSVNSRTVSRRGISYLGFAGMRFDELKLQIPILSGFETRETKLRSTIFFSKKTILVPKALVKTNAKLEKFAELDIDLNHVFDGHDDAIIHRHMSHFISQVMETAQERIEQEFGSRIVAGIPVSTIQSKLSIASSMHLSDRRVSDQANTPTPSPSGSYRTETSYDIIKSENTKPPHSQMIFPYYDKLPSQNLNFSGRQDILETIEQHLLPKYRSSQDSSVNRLQIYSIHGLGGMGKTQIAIEYAQSRKSHYDAIFWINAATREKLDICFCHIASQLGLLAQANSQDPIISRELVKGWLADPVKISRSSNEYFTPENKDQANWLIVFDKADQPDLIRDYWPQDGRGSILVTSRDPVVKTGIYFGGASTALKALTTAEATNLLQKLVGKEFDDTSSKASVEIVNRLDRIPLAISSMAGVICRQSLTLPEFTLLYSKETSLGELHNVKYAIYHGYDHTLGSAWALEKLNLAASSILNVASLLDPDSIPEEILIQNPEVAANIGFPQLPQTYFKQLAELTQSSVIVRNADTKELSLHGIVQEVVRTKMANTPQLLERTFDAAVKLTSTVWPFVTVAAQPGYANYTRIDRWDQCDKILPHILMLRHVFSTYNFIENTELVCKKELLVLLSEIAWYQLERATPASSIEVTNFAFDIIDHSTEDFREICSALHGTREQIAFETNDPAGCLFHAQQALSITEELCTESGKTGKLATAISEMGKACNRNQLYSKALEYYAQSRSIRESQKGFHKLALFTCLLGTGHSLWLLNRHEEASASIEEALRDRAEALGPDDTEGFRTGLALYALGSVKLSQGLHNESFSLHQRALRQYKATIGPTHHQFGDACYKVGEHHLRFQEHDFAKLLFEKALSVYRNEPYYFPEIARTSLQLAKTLQVLGESEVAKTYLDKALGLYRQLVPDDSRGLDELTDNDFDEIVCFWAR